MHRRNVSRIIRILFVGPIDEVEVFLKSVSDPLVVNPAESSRSPLNVHSDEVLCVGDRALVVEETEVELPVTHPIDLHDLRLQESSDDDVQVVHH